jgi:hypothetical protein
MKRSALRLLKVDINGFHTSQRTKYEPTAYFYAHHFSSTKSCVVLKNLGLSLDTSELKDIACNFNNISNVTASPRPSMRNVCHFDGIYLGSV